MADATLPMAGAGGIGEQFNEDLRTLPACARSVRAAGHGNAAARRWLTADELAPLTTLSNGRALGSLSCSVGLIALAVAAAIRWWSAPWMVALAVLLIGVQQHGLFILAHEAAHYRLFRQRRLNDAVGRLIGMSAGISMCSYRIIHRLHHNQLYGPLDPDTAIHGGYPRGVGYLWKKLGQDLIGWNAWKTYAYFFGAPALGDARDQRLVTDTSAELRALAARDRCGVVITQLALPLAALLLGGWRGLTMYAVLWLLPLLTVLQPILRLRAICEHGAVHDLSSPLTAARTNLTGRARSGRALDTAINRLGRAMLFPHHVNHHLEHHLYPAVPHYHLPGLHRLLQAKGALEGAEVRDLAETLRLIFSPRPPRSAELTPSAISAQPGVPTPPPISTSTP